MQTQTNRVYYKIERTFLTNAAGESEQQSDKTPYLVNASDAAAAARLFVSDERGRLLGEPTSFAGDKSSATAWLDGRLYIIFVQRGLEALRPGERQEARR